MAELKTKAHKGSVDEFLNSVEDDKRKEDSKIVMEMMGYVTGEKPTMWGTSIIGFGEYHYKYESGREGDFFIVGLSPRKQGLSIYIMDGFTRYESLMKKLGKYKTGKSCLYIKNLEDVDQGILKDLIGESYKHMLEKYPKKH